MQRMAAPCCKRRFDTFMLPDMASTKRLHSVSPGLDLNHGFVYQIRQNQFRRAHQDTQQIENSIQDDLEHKAITETSQANVKLNACPVVKLTKSKIERKYRRPSAMLYTPPGIQCKSLLTFD